VKTALIVTYVWPPFGHAPVQRVLRFAKYLPEFGWRPVILTVANPTKQMRTGESGEGIVEQLEVYRALTIEPPYTLKAKVRDWLRQKKTPPSHASTSAPLHAKVQILDTHAGWVPFAVLRGWPLLWQKQIDAMFVTAPPFSSLMIGVALAKLTKRPWVADFRDEWCGFLSWGYESGGGRNRFAEGMEARVVQSAGKVVSVSYAITNNFKVRYPKEPASKFITIRNGFDPADFPPSLTQARRGPTDKLRITFLGTIVRLHTPRYFLQAVADLARHDPTLPSKLEVHFYGRVANEELSHFLQPELNGIVQNHGYLPHHECPRILCESDVLLVNVDDLPGAERVPTTKIYEYFAAQRHILSLAPEGETATLVRNSGCGTVIHPHLVEELTQLLARWVDAPQIVRTSSAADVAFVEQFSRRRHAGQLAELFNELAVPR
jgi:glycosyltransferase involved in cell wall biosynthesis